MTEHLSMSMVVNKDDMIRRQREIIERLDCENSRLREALQGIDEWSMDYADARKRAKKALQYKPPQDSAKKYTIQQQGDGK